jgi:hypothetical protein
MPEKWQREIKRYNSGIAGLVFVSEHFPLSQTQATLSLSLCSGDWTCTKGLRNPHGLASKIDERKESCMNGKETKGPKRVQYLMHPIYQAIRRALLVFSADGSSASASLSRIMLGIMGRSHWQ